eukprot:TRINITY_DN1999_c0_g1_i3.p3 TRINITY_DN1999_c0_g1~~TRINITY_DN1999_c0_g1_i3.p3  ORF type:complete len:180 (-),score=17.00 TRINITY_DN1999_c0_g1_i3:678-1217(-)
MYMVQFFGQGGEFFPQLSALNPPLIYYKEYKYGAVRYVQYQREKLSNVDEPQEEDSNSYIRKNNTDEEGGQDLEEPQEEPQDKTIELNNSEPGQESAQQNVDNDTVIVPATGTMLSQRSLSSAASSSSSSSKNGSSQAMPYIIVVVLVVVLAVGYVVVRRRFSRRTQGFVPLTSITKDD